MDEAIDSGDEGRVIEALRSVKRAQMSDEAISRIKSLLTKTRSPRVRNAAALALADSRIAGTDKLLIELLKRPSTKGARGTLLYALEELKAKVPLAVLTKIIADDTYEAREEALDLLSTQGKFPHRQIEKALAVLQPMTRSQKTERANAAKAAIELLTENTGA